MVHINSGDSTKHAHVETLTDRTQNLQGKNALSTLASLFARVSDTIVKMVRLDAATEALITVDYAHHEIHDGTNFCVKGIGELTGAGAQFLIGITTPDTTKYAHFIEELASGDEYTIEMFEGSAFTGGTPISVMNCNRNSATVATVSLVSAPTVSNVGTLMRAFKTGSGRSVGGSAGGRAEMILKRNTKYLFRFTHVPTGTGWFGYLFDWYEHTNRN